MFWFGMASQWAKLMVGSPIFWHLLLHEFRESPIQSSYCFWLFKIAIFISPLIYNFFYAILYQSILRVKNITLAINTKQNTAPTNRFNSSMVNMV